MRSGLLGKMQDRHVTGRLLLEQDNVANAAFSEHERTSPSLTQNGHHTQAVPGKSIGQRIFFLSAPESQTIVRIPAACKFFFVSLRQYIFQAHDCGALVFVLSSPIYELNICAMLFRLGCTNLAFGVEFCSKRGAYNEVLTMVPFAICVFCMLIPTTRKFNPNLQNNKTANIF